MAKKRRKSSFSLKNEKKFHRSGVIEIFFLDYYGGDDNGHMVSFSILKLEPIGQQNDISVDCVHIKLFELGFFANDNFQCFSKYEDCELFLAVTSKQDFFVLIFNVDGEIEKSVLCNPIAEFNHKYGCQLFKALNDSKILNVKTCLLKSGSTIVHLSLNIYLIKQTVFDCYENFYKNFLIKNETILLLMAFLRDFPFSKKQTNDDLCLDKFYSLFYNYRNKFVCDTSLMVPNFNPNLRKYQECAVKWMLSRENNEDSDRKMHFFVKQTFENVDLYYHKVLGHFVTEDVFEQYVSNMKKPLGGILADEMGLGKTIEVLALILLNKNTQTRKSIILNRENIFSLSQNPIQGFLQCYCGDNNISIIETLSQSKIIDIYLKNKFYQNNDLIKCGLCANYQHITCSKYDVSEEDFPYVCSKCWINLDPIDSGCTLIVTPNSILQQWIDEIQKHVRNIRLFKYNGVKSKEYIFPPNLAKYDIVITSYDVLRSELDFSESHDYQHLRNNKRYFSQVSPLKSVHWWRICFDEAQLVEGTFTRVANMANSLSSKFRWAVTGTPIQKSVNDLFGLFYFIREDPFCHETIWNYGLYYPYCNGDFGPLISALSKCFWRTPKNNVLNEIGISEPIHSILKLEFSQIERDFYYKQSRKSQLSINEKLNRIDSSLKLSDLSLLTQSTILSSALKLRLCCCYPQLCIKNFSSIKQYGSLNDVLNAMIEDAKYECEREHRCIISSCNGMAAYFVQYNRLDESIIFYEKALESVEKYRPFFRTDATQVYHIYYNLAQIVEFYGVEQINKDQSPLAPFNGVQFFESQVEKRSSPSFTDDHKYLRLKAKEMYENYISKAKLACITTDRYRLEQIKKCEDIKKEFKFEKTWHVYAIQVLNNILNQLEINSILSTFPKFFIETESLNPLRMLLDNVLSDIEVCRANIIKSFQFLTEQIVFKKDIIDFINCHIKKISNVKCSLCEVDEDFKLFEKNMFDVKRINQANNTESNWNESNYIYALRRIGQLFKSKATSVVDYYIISQDINLFVDYLEEIKKEFKVHRKLLTNLTELVLRIDELDQAQTRHIIDSTEPEFQYLMSMEDSKNISENNLKMHLNRLKYLSNLQNSVKNRNEVELRICSICWCDLKSYFVMLCGHFYCFSCMVELKKRCSDKIQCSVCRAEYDRNTLCCIDSSPTANITVVGSWSTKILTILRTIIPIIKLNEKILIFSTWNDMLLVMQKALEENEIISFFITGPNGKFVQKIKSFQQCPKGCTLLLPTNFASKGLNLVEASHVVFINSSLNKTDELQAIGRIYRIGQTKQTYVHKFIIKDTIEELIENYNDTMHTNSNNKKSEFNNLTVEQFRKLFCH